MRFSHTKVGFLLNYIGGTIRWIYGSIWRSIANKPKFKFKEYIYGSEKPDYYDEMGHELNNLVIAFITIIIIISLLT